ncbi:MAG: MraY family glycosyltransferase, partial [Myxococcota bacterium]|nr:MraY family glycosyltransferase [Myxococcota bacterium]
MGALDGLMAAGIGGLVAGLATPLAILAARRLDVLDRPGGYKAHGAPTPLLGGLAVAAGALAGSVSAIAAAAPAARAALLALGAGAGVILIAGLLDDVRHLSAPRKFAWQLGAAAGAGLLLAALGVRLELYLGWSALPIGLLTALWIVGITNAVNFFDNMDGLCAGTGAIAALALALTNARSGEWEVALCASALAGACLGFLPWSWPRARIFLGDAGSMWIGFSLAALAVMGVYTRGAEAPGLAVLTPLLVLAVPVVDAAFVLGLRLRAGHAPWRGDRRHLSHRLVSRGLRPASAVAVVWAASALCALVALWLPFLAPGAAWLALGGVAAGLAALLAVSGGRGLPAAQPPPRPAQGGS